jgi:hypothetical protein
MSVLDRDQNERIARKEDKTGEIGNKLIQRIWDVSVIVSLVIIAVLLRACYNNESEIPGGITTSQLVSDTEDFMGKTVTIRSEVIERVGRTSFTVEDERFFRDDEPILVINASGMPFNLPVDDNTDVLITGQVRRLVIPDIEREFNLILEDDYYIDYVDRPVIVAQYIALAPKPGEVTQNPRLYYGKRLAVTGEVENIESSVLFTLDEDQLLGGQDLLVLLTQPLKVAINEDQNIAVVGVVRPFVVADLEREYNLTWDLNIKRQLELEYKNRPVLVGESVYPGEYPE